MSQEQRTLLAISLMLGLVIVYQALFAPRRPPEQPASQTPAATQAAAPAKPAAPPDVPQRPAATPEREIPVETSTVSAILTTRGAGIKSWRLKDYVVADKGPVDIIAPLPPGAAPSLAAWGYAGLPAAEAFVPDKTSLRLSAKDEAAITFSRRDPSGLKTEKRLRFHGEGYTVDVEVRLRNEGTQDMVVDPKVVWGPGFHESREKDKEAAQRRPTIWLNSGRIEDDPKDLKPGALKVHEGKVSWTALHDTYFAAALIPETQGASAFVAVAEDGQALTGLKGASGTLRPGEEMVFRAKVYGGPKDIDQLAAAAPNLDRLVDMGWFLFSSLSIIDYGLARPALYLLRFLRGITGNYGLAIILLTIILKAALFPLTQKSLKSMQAMQALQPKIQAIKEKYKNNPQKRNQEMADLMRRHNVSGAAGCLPMLAQMPIFIGLYNALSSAIELWQARFLWVKDLSAPEHGLFAATIPFLGHTEVRILPLLMGATQFLQMKMSPTSADPAQAAVMTYMMPVFMTFIFYGFPSGLVLYWLCFNVLQIAQQYLLNKSQAKKALAPAG